VSQTATQSANPWRSAQAATPNTIGGLAICPPKPTYKAKYCSATYWRSAWRSDPVSWRSDPFPSSRPPHRHGRHRWRCGKRRGSLVVTLASSPGGGTTRRANASADAFTLAVGFLSPCSEARNPKRKRTPRDRARERRRRRPNRGYGRHHRKLRQRLTPFVASGRAICARCGRPIAVGEPWDLGHDDRDRGLYVGPEHRACNRAAGPRLRRSRRW
jgi:hypothetical protein